MALIGIFSTSLAGSLKDRGRLNNNLTGPPCRALSFNSPPGGVLHLVQIAAKLKMPGVSIVKGIWRYLRYLNTRKMKLTHSARRKANELWGSIANIANCFFKLLKRPAMECNQLQNPSMTDLIFVIFSPQMYFLSSIFLHIKARKLWQNLPKNSQNCLQFLNIS